MRLLEDHCRSWDALALLRERLEGDQRRSLAILGPDRATSFRFFSGLLYATGRLGHGLGTLLPDDPLPAEHAKALGFFTVERAADIPASAKLRAFLRQDPDAIFCSLAGPEEEALLFSAAMTGHQILAIFPDVSIEALAARLRSSLPQMEAEYALAAFDLLEVDVRFEHNRLSALVHGKPSADGKHVELSDLVRRRTPDFELGRDEERDSAFLRALYVVIPPAKTAPPKPAAPVPAPAPKPSPTADPIDALALAPPTRRALRQLQRAAHLPVLGAELSGDALWAPLQASPGWPRAMGKAQAALLILQLRTDELPSDLAFLPAGALLQIFFDSETANLDDPFGNATVRLVPEASLAPEWPAELRGSLLKERFPIERFELWPFDYPGWEERQALLAGALTPDSARDLDLPTAEGTKLAGWPAWEQAPETPSCPACGKALRHVFQFRSAGTADTLISGDFSSYLFTCPEHLEVWALVHQCS